MPDPLPGRKEDVIGQARVEGIVPHDDKERNHAQGIVGHDSVAKESKRSSRYHHVFHDP